MEAAVIRPDDPRLEHLEFDLGDVTLHAVAAGPQDGPLVILLHGFPEFWYGWRTQILPLAEAGFRVVAPDQRGYNLSSKPSGVAAYDLHELAADVAGIADGLSRDAFDVVGHDWGGIVAWWAALRYPKRVRRLVAINAPHPVAARRFAKRRWSQLLRSWYIFFFQLPRVPEWLLSFGGFAGLRAALQGSAPRHLFDAAEMAVYRQAWSRPGAVRAMVNWYRALPKFRSRGTKLQVRQPALILWGDGDWFLDSRLAEASAEFCDDARIVPVEAGSHWLQHVGPDLVMEELLTFLGSQPR
jgi:pimeloyl-ACP methyl ester carboxylesterase